MRIYSWCYRYSYSRSWTWTIPFMRTRMKRVSYFIDKFIKISIVSTERDKKKTTRLPFIWTLHSVWIEITVDCFLPEFLVGRKTHSCSWCVIHSPGTLYAVFIFNAYPNTTPVLLGKTLKLCVRVYASVLQHTIMRSKARTNMKYNRTAHITKPLKHLMCPNCS